MKNLTEEKINENLVLFVKKLKTYEIDTDLLFSVISEESLKNAPGYVTKESGVAYKGGMINFVLRNVAKYAIQLNGLLPEDKRIDQTSLIKVVLLHQIAKADMYQVNNDSLGNPYQYKQQETKLKCGERSLYLCQKAGITFNESEYYAMTIMDKVNDNKTNYDSRFDNTLSKIIVVANQMATIEILN